jgi:hypothetical protein
LLFWGKKKGGKAGGETPGPEGGAAQPGAEGEDRQSAGSVVREFIYGMAAHDMTRYALKTRSSMEHLFILITMGDLLGVPILPPYYSLRLLPYVVPQIATWKRRMLREKDLTDALF